MKDKGQPAVAERWRPARHLTAARGFINDPNGLIEIDGRYHAFYQHNPHATVHGPMHWGHAVSDDLVHWRELPIALHPDALGQCFSGSAVPTSTGDVALFYTAHLERDDDEPLQTQCLVRADRTLTRFVSEATNPVLGNPDALTDYRDPKVFRHPPSEAWIMLITHGRHIGIYRSSDLVSWALASEFGQGRGVAGEGAWECPDLVEVPDESGGRRWVLIVGVWSGAAGGGSGTQYFIGAFDGHRFSPDDRSETVLWFDHGRDCYAVQSFAGRDDRAPRVLGWFSNWQYANETPTLAFRGALTLPRDLSLVETPAGSRVRQCIPAPVAEAFPLFDGDGRPPGAVFRMCRELGPTSGEQLEVRLFGESNPAFVIQCPGEGAPWRLGVSRDAVLGNGRRLEAFAGDHEVILVAPVDRPLRLELFVDHGLVELLLGDGVDVATTSFYPTDPAGEVSLTRCRSR